MSEKSNSASDSEFPKPIQEVRVGIPGPPPRRTSTANVAPASPTVSTPAVPLPTLPIHRVSATTDSASIPTPPVFQKQADQPAPEVEVWPELKLGGIIDQATTFPVLAGALVDDEVEVNTHQDGDGEEPQAARKLGPWAVSMGLHAVLLVVLGVWFLPALLPKEESWLLVYYVQESDTGEAEIVPEIQQAPAMPTPTVPTSEPVSQPVTSDIAPKPPVEEPPTLVDLPETGINNPNTLDVNISLNLPKSPQGTVPSTPAANTGGKRGTRWTPDVPTGSGARMARVQDTDEATGQLLARIQGKFEADDLLVVWLIDRSASLLDDRQRMASLVEDFLLKLRQRDRAATHHLSNAVVSYGAQVKVEVQPTETVPEVIRAFRKLPTDPSGLENVMTAVEVAVGTFAPKWKGQLLLVVWTDESGDDIGKLENVVNLLRDKPVEVCVVGPSAMFGKEMGAHPWFDANFNTTLYLPVKRGPDTALPEQVQAPYWFASGHLHFGGPGIPPRPAWAAYTQTPGATETLLSGFGPYALSRLTRETGGIYYLCDPPDHPQMPSVLLPPPNNEYMPDYRSLAEYLQSVQAVPLRKAVLESAMITHQAGDTMKPPRMNFFGQYMDPSPFRIHLPKYLQTELNELRKMEQVLSRALAGFGPGMEEDYEFECSARWRAWYDLNRGRLLALQVRCYEYAFVTQSFLRAANRPGGLSSTANSLTFLPDSNIKSGPRTEALAAEAMRLLTRCLAQNANTPWATLAAAEIEHGLSFQLDIQSIPRPPPTPAAPVSGAVGGKVGGGGGGAVPRL